jgi:hypothetical protein
MNPYEPPQTEPAKLDGPPKTSLWLIFIFGFPVFLFIGGLILMLLG